MPNELNLADPILVEGAIAESRTDILSSSTVLPSHDVNTALSFRIPAVPEFTDLSPTVLELEMKILFDDPSTDEVKIKDSEKAACINNVMWSIFSGADIWVNGQQIMFNNGCLPWSAYLQNLSYNYDTRQSFLSGMGWLDDTPDMITSGITNTNAVKRMSKLLLGITGK